MTVRLSSAACVLALAAVPLASFAQVEQFYAPPRVIARGTNTTPIAGSGTVRLQVFVKRDGSVGTIKVQKSTNPADNAAAIEIAKTTKYKPGARDAKPIDAFYTYDLKFNGSVVTGGSDTGHFSQVSALLQAGQYAQAQELLKPYVADHPNDVEANTLLGVADSFANDSAGAAAAFDKAGTIPVKYRGLAAQAYLKLATQQLAQSNFSAALPAATRSVDLSPSAGALNARGIAETGLKQTDAAIADLTKARAMVASDPRSAAAIDGNLANAYLIANQPDNALATAKRSLAGDAQNQTARAVLLSAYDSQAGVLIAAGKRPDAAALLERGASDVPASAATLLALAAAVRAGDAKPDWAAVKADADRALAVDPNNARANYVEAIALYNTGKRPDAVTYLNKAKANVGSNDAQLAAQIDDALKNISTK